MVQLTQGEKVMYRIFTRNWWRTNPDWPDGREPDARCQKRHVKYVKTEAEARTFCNENNKHRPSSWLKLSRKYEFEGA